MVAPSPPEGSHPVAPPQGRPVGSEAWSIPKLATFYTDDAGLVPPGRSAEVE